MHSTSIFDSEAGNFQNAYGCDPVIHDVSNFLQELESPSERERIFSQVALRYLELEPGDRGILQIGCTTVHTKIRYPNPGTL